MSMFIILKIDLCFSIKKTIKKLSELNFLNKVHSVQRFLNRAFIPTKDETEKTTWNMMISRLNYVYCLELLVPGSTEYKKTDPASPG